MFQKGRSFGCASFSKIVTANPIFINQEIFFPNSLWSNFRVNLSWLQTYGQQAVISILLFILVMNFSAFHWIRPSLKHLSVQMSIAKLPCKEKNHFCNLNNHCWIKVLCALDFLKVNLCSHYLWTKGKNLYFESSYQIFRKYFWSSYCLRKMTFGDIFIRIVP